MKIRAHITSALVLLLGAITAFAVQSTGHFGATFTDAKVVPLAEVISNVERYKETPVKVEGEIRDVCQNKGCWLVISDGEREMRVTFKDYGFFVPKDSSGKKVVLEGLVVRKTISEDHAKHYAEESKGKVDPASIKGPQEVVTMVATGVSIKAR